MDFISWISQFHIAIKLIGILTMGYGFYALARMTKAKTESEASIPLLLGGSSLAMGMLIFALGVTQFLAGEVGL